MGCGAVGAAVLADHLRPKSFGTYGFCVSLLTLAALPFEFGLFTPAARRIAGAIGNTRREVIGTAVLLFVPVAVFYSTVIFALSYALQPVFSVDAGATVRIIAPITFGYAFASPFAIIAQGADRVGLAATCRALGQLVFVGVVAICAWQGFLSTRVAILINTCGLLVVTVTGIAFLKPIFRNAGAHIRAIALATREWGVHIYVGRLLSMGTYNMDVLMVTAFTTTRQAGFYVLAASIASASGLPMTGLGNASFRRMASTRVIPQKWLVLAWACGAASVVGVIFLAPPVIATFLPASYAPVARLAIPLTMAQAVSSVTGIYNTYLSSGGNGRELRTCGIVLTSGNLIANFALIPPFGATGAAWASFLALLPNYAAHAHFYRKRDAPQVSA